MPCAKNYLSATASGSASATLQPIMTRPKTEIDYCLTTIVREVSKAGLPRVFNGFQEIQRSRVFSVKTVQPLKAQHFIRIRLKTPSVDIAPVKLYPYVKSKTQTQMHELASCFCPYQLYPYDTLCTYGVKQLKLLGFSR